MFCRVCRSEEVKYHGEVCDKCNLREVVRQKKFLEQEVERVSRLLKKANQRVTEEERRTKGLLFEMNKLKKERDDLVKTLREYNLD